MIFFSEFSPNIKEKIEFENLSKIAFDFQNKFQNRPKVTNPALVIFREILEEAFNVK